MAVKLRVALKNYKVAIVCGYGLVRQFENKTNQTNRIRSIVEMNGLYNWYQSVSYFCNQNKIFDLIFTGGFTNEHFPQFSESQTAIEYFRRNFGYIFDHEVNYEFEEQSNSTHGNIFHAMLEFFGNTYSNESDISDYEFIIFCDSNRRFKVQILAFIFFGYTKLNYRVVHFDREDIHKNSNTLYQTMSLFKVLFDKLFWENVKLIRNKIDIR